VADRPALNTLNKFIDFQKDGRFGKFIVTPEKMSWQITKRNYKNDVGYTGRAAANYPTSWIDDNLWLPSASEANGGIWATSASMRVNGLQTWTRRGSESPSVNCHVAGAFQSNGRVVLSGTSAAL